MRMSMSRLARDEIRGIISELRHEASAIRGLEQQTRNKPMNPGDPGNYYLCASWTTREYIADRMAQRLGIEEAKT